MAQTTQSGRPLSKDTKIKAFAAFDKALVDPDNAESRTELHLRLGISRQHVHTLYKKWLTTIDGGRERVEAMAAARAKAVYVESLENRNVGPRTDARNLSAPESGVLVPGSTPEDESDLDLDFVQRDLVLQPFTRPEKMDIIERAIRRGGDRVSAYRVAMISRHTGDLWIKQNVEGLGDRVRRAESLVVTGIATNLFRIAMSNRPDAGTIGLRLLAIKSPDEWAEKQRIQIESDLFIHDVSRLMVSPESAFLVSQLGASMTDAEIIENPPQADLLPAHEDGAESNGDDHE